MKSVKFLPWVGQNYADGLNGIKTLILGESHYQWECGRDINEWREVTQRLVQEQVDGPFTKAFWTKIVIAFIGHSPTQDEKKKFWSSVVFYNYVQESAGDAPRIAPKRESWASSEDAFLEVLETLKPDFILILGDRLTGNLSRFLTERSIDIQGANRTATFKMRTSSNSHGIAYPILHPSRGFNGRTWKPFIMQAMQGN